MKTTDLTQGTPEWHDHRATHFNASDAPAMMGCSTYSTRTALLRRMKTGIAPAVNPATQQRFDDGHRFEALARPLAEAIIGEELFPVTGTKGVLSASFDGLTACEDIAFEHKTLNAQLRALLMNGCAGSDLPMQYQVQMEQQCIVSGAGKVLFMASKWIGDELLEERHCWYVSDEELADKIRRGWSQFKQDLADYVPPAVVESVEGHTMEALPALLISVRGEVTASNLQAYKTHALAVFGAINRDLTTDQDFADASKTVKWCADVEARLAQVKQHALSQTATIDDIFKAIDEMSAEARRVRLDLDKLITKRNNEVRYEMISRTQAAYNAHVANVEDALEPYVMAGQRPPQFADAIKGKRSLLTMQDALDAALAGAKINADTACRDCHAKLDWFISISNGYRGLFADMQTLLNLQYGPFQACVNDRIQWQKQLDTLRVEQMLADAQALIQPVQVKAIQAGPVITITQARMPVNNTRAKIDAHLAPLGEDALARVLSFLHSRYPLEVSA